MNGAEPNSLRGSARGFGPRCARKARGEAVKESLRMRSIAEICPDCAVRGSFRSINVGGHPGTATTVTVAICVLLKQLLVRFKQGEEPQRRPSHSQGPRGLRWSRPRRAAAEYVRTSSLVEHARSFTTAREQVLKCSRYGFTDDRKCAQRFFASSIVVLTLAIGDARTSS
eukprot:6180048-Pleurochrysis_carterae.AAC.1